MKAIAKIRIKRELNKRLAIKQNEIQLNLINFILISNKNEYFRTRLWSKIYRRHKKFSVTKCRNHCLVTGRGHSIYRTFRLARNALKYLALDGKLYGIRKASW